MSMGLSTIKASIGREKRKREGIEVDLIVTPIASQKADLIDKCIANKRADQEADHAVILIVGLETLAKKEMRNM